MAEGVKTEREWMDYVVQLRNCNPSLLDAYKDRLSQGKVGIVSRKGKGNIPVLFANGASLAEAWENALLCLWKNGGFVRTQYDPKDKESGLYTNGPSMDSTMNWVVEEPLSEPMIHRDFPGGLDALEEYRQEVVDGIKDNWIRDPKNPDDERWEYTYHRRLCSYDVPGLEKSLDQFKIMVDNLAKSPITRRAQMITWKPWEDSQIGDPACLQSIWGRILRAHPEAGFEFYSDEETGKPMLNTNIRFRSWDSYGAAFMNIFAFIDFIKGMAAGISEKRGEEVGLARIACYGDSFHIYYKDFKDFLGRFAKGVETRHFAPEDDYDNEARTWNLGSELTQSIFAETRRQLPIKIAEQNAKYEQGVGMTKDSTVLFKEPPKE